MRLRMLDTVFQDEAGVVHYRVFETPETVCRETVLRFHDAGCTGEGYYNDGSCSCGKARSIHRYGGMPLSSRELPNVTCMLCLAEATDPAWDQNPR